MPEQPNLEIPHSTLNCLVQAALSLGASEARLIPSEIISAREDLAKYCHEPRCKDYGSSSNCPPYVSGPAGFRELQETHHHALVLRIAVPAAALLSEEGRQIWRRLHEVTAGVERVVIEMGYSASRGFAGSSCKVIFCPEEPVCPILAGKGACPYAQIARPSMSGFGIDVVALMKACDWHAEWITHQTETRLEGNTWVAGLVMIG